MPAMNRLTPVIAALLTLTGCAAGISGPQIACSTNDECKETEVCFPGQGCVDPSQNLVVEVTGDAQSGLFAQDISVPSLAATQNFELPGQLKISGEFTRENSSTVDPSNRSAYTEKVFVRATGKSLLIPGVVRSYESTITDAPRGLYSMTIGSGSFSFTAIPGELSVPPVSTLGVVVREATDDNVVNFVFPSVKGSVPLAGRLIRQKTASGEIAITTASMTIQVFHPTTGLPLSQRASVSSGFAGSKGDFSLMVNPEVKDLTQVVVVATPQLNGAMVPSKSFVMQYPFPQQPVLEMGDFGEAITGLTGKALDAAGRPVGGARVLIRGLVNGGGEFSSAIVATDAEGRFTVSVLPHKEDAPYSMVVLPLPGAQAGLWTGQVRVDSKQEQPILVPSSVTCPERIKVSGKVLLPDGRTAADGVGILASSKAGTSLQIPSADSETETDAEGLFSIWLDPGVWQLEFEPEHMPRPLPLMTTLNALSGGDLPRMSRTLTVKAVPIPIEGTEKNVTIPEYILQNGRTVTGTVTSNISSRAGVPVANASLRFFRLTQIEGKDAAILVGTTTADERGAYSVVMPVR